MASAENYLPFIEGERTPTIIYPVTGVQIGQAVLIPPADVYLDEQGVPTFDLLDMGQEFSEEDYPVLASIFTDLVVPSSETATGAPYPYKMVADYTGGT